MNKTRMCLLSTLMLSFVALAQNTPAPRTVDLKASDDTVLKGSYLPR